MKLSKSPSFDEDWMYHQLLLTINISKIPSVLTKKSTGGGGILKLFTKHPEGEHLNQDRKERRRQCVFMWNRTLLCDIFTFNL